MRIEFTRSGGFAGTRLSRTFDTDTMPAEDARELTALVEAAGFFALPASLRSGGADKFQYNITVEKDGKKHTVEADERAVPPALAPLVKKLEAAARSRTAS
jgi:hypothetical protein